MLKSLRMLTITAALLTIQIALPVIAAPKDKQPSTPKEVYIGRFSYNPYTRDVYLLPSTIKARGDLKRFQERYVYQQIQDDGLGKYKYWQSVVYWTANCRDGKSGIQKGEDFDNRGKKVGESVWELELKVPEPESINEKALDFVCDYKN